MLIKIKIIILLTFITVNIVFAVENNNLKLTKEGIVSTSTNKILNKSIKKNKVSTYLYTIGYLKNIGNVIFYESLNNYKKYCYLPINKIVNTYKVKGLTCIEIVNDFTSSPPVIWMATYINLNNKDLEKLDFIKLLEKTNVQKKTFAKLQDNYLIFEDLPLIDKNGEELDTKHTFLIKHLDTGFPMIELSDLIIPNKKINKK